MILHAAAGFCCPSPTLLPAKPSWRRRICSIFRLILHRRIGLQQEIAHWTQIEIERLHVAATYNVLVGDPSAVVQSGLGYLLITDDHLLEPLNPLLCFRPLSPSPKIRRALVPKRYAVFTKAADAFLQAAKSLHESDRMPLDSPV